MTTDTIRRVPMAKPRPQLSSLAKPPLVSAAGAGLASSDRSLESRHGLLICFALAVATLAVYWQVSGFDFVAYDDWSYVQETPQVRAGLTAPGIAWALGAARNANWHPLTWISYMLDVQLFGLNGGAHHVTSLLLHVANTL